ncbi:MAG: InlB B-repeat-containing protein [Alphaproteobacteria bacterium]|nr:InlB B-repeat-containing protein [Alphaproteobacteria bacterium]
MKKFLILLFVIFICSIAHADTETINWYVDGNTYATTTCEIGGGVSLPDEPTKYGYDFIGWSEIFNRGTFANWAAIPNSAGGYLGDSNGSNIPQENDYIIVNDASDVPEYGENIEMYAKSSSSWSWSKCNTYVDSIDYGFGEYLYEENIYTYTTSCGYSARTCAHWRSDTRYVVCSGVIYEPGNVFFTVVADDKIRDGKYNGGKSFYAKFITGYPYSGKWLLRYHGNWNDLGRGGWVAEKQLD